MIKILIADDHPVVREGLKQIISRASEVTVGGEALNGPEVLQKAAAEKWDAVVLDIGMTGRDGLDILKELHAEKTELPVHEKLNLKNDVELTHYAMKHGLIE